MTEAQYSDESNTNKALAKRLSKLSYNTEVVELAQKYGLDVQITSWEDTGRSKNSSYGPNISDMTLFAEGHNMAMIRKPNYEDSTCDVSLDKFYVSVGNENEKKDTSSKRIQLKEFLQNIKDYTNEKVKSMYLERDEKILTSAQACILPADKDGSVEFNVRLFNYQSDETDPAVLVVVASANGTSCQVVTEREQKLYFNEAGQACNFVAKGLVKHRKDKGVTDASALKQEMNQEEREQNVLFVFQIPLKQKPKKQSRGGSFSMLCCESKDNYDDQLECLSGEECEVDCNGNFEDAILMTGKSHSTFKGTRNLSLERDSRFPIRCTVQFYKISDTVKIHDREFEKIANKIKAIYNDATIYGSLVVDGTSKRVTEPELCCKN